MTSCLDDTFYPEDTNQCQFCNQYIEQWQANLSICYDCWEKLEKTTGEIT